MEKILIVGATSGIGYAIAQILLDQGYTVGVSGRRVEQLTPLKERFPQSCHIERIDIIEEDTPQRIDSLIEKMGGVDTFIHSSGIGSSNIELDPQIEIRTARTNVEGLIRTTTHIFNHFRDGGGHIAVISSVAGTRTLGSAVAYSATKRFQHSYMDGLSQLATITRSKIHITDIRPGFVRTPLIEGRTYPMEMKVNYAAKRIIKAIERKRRVAIIDWRYRLLVLLWRAIPEWLWERLPIK
ncbi:MAG: SDR family NAD(P)-dependent oxidoreductase [Rikenellaceae bacterium]